MCYCRRLATEGAIEIQRVDILVIRRNEDDFDTTRRGGIAQGGYQQATHTGSLTIAPDGDSIDEQLGGFSAGHRQLVGSEAADQLVVGNRRERPEVGGPSSRASQASLNASLGSENTSPIN